MLQNQLNLHVFFRFSSQDMQTGACADQGPIPVSTLMGGVLLLLDSCRRHLER